MSRNNKRKEDSLPCNLDAERFILGSLMIDCSRFSDVAGVLLSDDLAIETHRRIFARMLNLHERGEKIDRVTVANELMTRGELESIGGLTYLISLDDGLPIVSNLDSYVKIVRDKSALRRIAMSAQHLLNRAMMAEESPEDVLSGAEDMLLRIGDDRERDGEGLQQAGDFIRAFPGGWNAFAEPSKRANGLRTGYTKFDEMTGGLHPGELTILAARPSVGKTALALNIAWNAAVRSKVAVAVFSLEMSTESLLNRMLCSAARIDSQRFRAGYLNEQERHKLRTAGNEMVEAPLFIDDASNIGILELHAKLRRLKFKHKVDIGLVVVDYLQLMARPGKGDNENADLTRLTRGLKLMSREMNCPFIVLSQLNRSAEQRTGDHRPQMSDLRGSGSIEQDADNVVFIFREEMHKRDREDLRGLAELILAKQRQGPIGTVNLVFLHSQTRFENRAEDLGDVDEETARLPYSEG